MLLSSELLALVHYYNNIVQYVGILKTSIKKSALQEVYILICYDDTLFNTSQRHTHVESSVSMHLLGIRHMSVIALIMSISLCTQTRI